MSMKKFVNEDQLTVRSEGFHPAASRSTAPTSNVSSPSPTRIIRQATPIDKLFQEAHEIIERSSERKKQGTQRSPLRKSISSAGSSAEFYASPSRPSTDTAQIPFQPIARSSSPLRRRRVIPESVHWSPDSMEQTFASPEDPRSLIAHRMDVIATTMETLQRFSANLAKTAQLIETTARNMDKSSKVLATPGYYKRHNFPHPQRLYQFYPV